MTETNEAFVYLWRDSVNKKFYLGYHGGTPDDNYAHSSSLMESFNMNAVPSGYKRRILARGSAEEMIDLEQQLLKNRKERGRWDKYHNVKIGTFPNDPAFRKMMGELWKDPEFLKNHAKRMTAQLKKQWADPEYRERMSKMMSARSKEWWEDPEYREKQVEERKARWTDPDYREYREKQSKIMSVRVKGMWQDPEYREKQVEMMSARNKEWWADPEYREKQVEMMSARNKEWWADPEYRERMSKKRKELWQDPEYREKLRGVCYVCGHESNKSAITRWHNDRCKKLKELI